MHEYNLEIKLAGLDIRLDVKGEGKWGASNDRREETGGGVNENEKAAGQWVGLHVAGEWWRRAL